MHTYIAGKDNAAQDLQPDTREWVFDLLPSSRYRPRLEKLAGLDLRRRAGCEPCLRALVLDDWTPETLHHMGWCESCRSAAIALGMGAPGAAGWHRRRALWLVLAAGVAVAAPLVWSQILNDSLTQGERRGGVAAPVPHTVKQTPRSKPAVVPAVVAPAVGHSRSDRQARSDRQVRSKPAQQVRRTLPKTT